MMRPVTLTLIALAAGLLAAHARAEPPRGPAAAAPDSLVRSLVAPAPSPFAPTVCVVPEDRDVRAVRQVLDEQVAAWNRGDLAGYMRGYWKSDSLTFYGGGEITHGWQVTFDRYRRRYQSEGREMGRLAFDPLEIELLAPGEAFVRGGWSLEMKTGRPHGLFTLRMRWFPDAGWRIVHDHSSSAS